MEPLVEISQAIRARRADIGLTQARVAAMSGLSRATINQIEKGSIKDLSLTRTARLLDVLGLSLTISPARDRRSAVDRATPALVLASRTASVSYRDELPPSVLEAALATGEVPASFGPHLKALLDEASMQLLSRVAEEVHAERDLPVPEIWTHMRALARRLNSHRDVWQ